MINYLAKVATENLMKFTTLFDILPPIPKFDDHSSLPIPLKPHPGHQIHLLMPRRYSR